MLQPKFCRNNAHSFIGITKFCCRNKNQLLIGQWTKPTLVWATVCFQQQQLDTIITVKCLINRLTRYNHKSGEECGHCPAPDLTNDSLSLVNKTLLMYHSLGQGWGWIRGECIMWHENQYFSCNAEHMQICFDPYKMARAISYIPVWS